MRHEPIASDLFRDRRDSFFKQMKRNSIAFFFSHEPMRRRGDQDFPFHQDADLFALSGIDQSGTLLVLVRGASSKDVKALLFILPADKRNTIWNGKRHSKKDAHRISGIEDIHNIHDWEKITNPHLRQSDTVYVNAAIDEKPQTDRMVMLNERHATQLRSQWPEKTFLSAQPILANLMMIKHSVEIGLMKKAIDVTGNAFHQVLTTLKPGMMEYEIEGEISRIIISKGCQHSFEPIVASGLSACTLHYVRNDARIQKGTLLLLDFGAEYAGMSSDMSRTIPASGKFSKRQLDIYLQVLNILNQVTDMMLPGTTIAQLNKETGKLIDQALIRLKLADRHDIRNQSPGKPLRHRYFMHGVSHHLGWEVHDKHDRQSALKPGMILTCEPGLYIREEKTGIRLENDILITRGSPKNLMAAIPIEPGEIESIMNSSSR